MRRHSENALAVAYMLRSHPKVRAVIYPAFSKGVKGRSPPSFSIPSTAMARC
ncbi:hypothetical protein ACOJBO_12480 [Rhizobium beringeri]